MTSRRNIVTQRCAAAWGDLRGRPAKPDYGLLIVLPFLAAAGGAFLGQALESAVRLLATTAVRPARPAAAGHAAPDPAEQSTSTVSH